MISQERFNLGRVLIALSHSLELISGELCCHQTRTAVISSRLADRIGLGEDRKRILLQAALLHDIGALKPEDKLSVHEQINYETVEHCVLGSALCNRVGWLRPSVPIIEYHHHSYQNLSGIFEDSRAAEIQILYLADLIERRIDRYSSILPQRQRIQNYLNCMVKGNLHPGVYDAFQNIAGKEAFWLDMVNPDCERLLDEMAPLSSETISKEQLFELSRVFRCAIDYRSRFTATHSAGVSQCAVLLAGEFGFAGEDTEDFALAGRVHDIGKMAVPTAILEKEGSLNNQEVEIMKQHPYHTYTILKNIPGIDHIASWASFHHERQDGRGYPFHIAAEDLDPPSRILAVADKFSALSEDRPYRKGLGFLRSKEILVAESRDGVLDPHVVDCLCDTFSRHREEIEAVRHKAAKDYSALLSHAARVADSSRSFFIRL